MQILETKTKVLNVSDLRPNNGQLECIGVHANPRQISKGDYAKLLNSLRENNMTGVLPLKVFKHEGEWYVLGGNMRLRAMQELGIEKVSCIIVPEDADAAALNEIIIKDNSTLGEWDMDALANEWSDMPLNDWGVDVPPVADESALDDLFEDDNTAKKDKGSAFTIEIPKCYKGVIEDIKAAVTVTLEQCHGCSIK